jgi:biotin-dependent carboxylase-like uncharacterized protein
MSDGRLHILAGGLATTIQDLGRYGFQRLGVAPAGALDAQALRLANALVGNMPGEAGLEILLLGPRFRVEQAAVRLALVGAETGLIIDGRRHPPNGSVTVTPGAEITIPAFPGRASAILAIGGGLDLTPVMGSRSTDRRAGFGELEGRALKTGDVLPLRAPAPTGPERWSPPLVDPTGPIRIVLGPQAEHFTDAAVATFLGETYTVSPESDRMGLRLAGPALAHRAGPDIVSDGIVTGAIQVPGNGQPIILLPDRQTTGGYAKIGCVISADLPRLGRRRPGDDLRFEAVDVETAVVLRRDTEAEFQALLGQVRDMSPDTDSEALLGINLIGGVVSADG